MFNVNTNATFGCKFIFDMYFSECMQTVLYSSKNIHTPHRRSLEIPKGTGAQRLKFSRVVGAQV